MEQIIHFEQFYYTNYGQGMRFEGSSDRRLEEELKLLAGSWMETDTDFPVETIAYNDNLNSYVAALVVPCSKVGDIRGSYWIHAVLPKSNKDGFLECLSWPLENYQQEVALRQTLSEVRVPAVHWDPEEIRMRYGLTGRRLTELMYMVWQTVCGTEKSSTLYLIARPPQGQRNRLAREMMAVIYDILPDKKRKEASYQAFAGSEIHTVHFAFRETAASGWQFDLEGDGGRSIDIPEEELHFMEMLTEAYMSGEKEYRRLVNSFYRYETDTFQDMVWAYYLKRMEQREPPRLSQETLVRCQPYLEQKAVGSLEYRRLYCDFLAAIDTEDQSLDFVQQVTDKYIVAAAGLAGSGCLEYRDSQCNIWKLLNQLSEGSREVAFSYLEWIRQESPAFYRDFVRYGLDHGKQWILSMLGSGEVRTVQELRQWMEDMRFLSGSMTYDKTVAEKAEALYLNGAVGDADREWLLSLCRDRGQMKIKALESMSPEQLLQMDAEAMDAQSQNQWLHVMAGKLEQSPGLVGSRDAAITLGDYVAGMSVVQQCLPYAPRMADGAQEPDKDALTVILTAVWRWQAQMDVKDKYILCLIGGYGSHMPFGRMSADFWQGIGWEDFEPLYEVGGKSVEELFGQYYQQEYLNFKIYRLYREYSEQQVNKKMWDAKIKGELLHLSKKRLNGKTMLAGEAIWQYWRTHESANIYFMYNILCYLQKKANVIQKLTEYGASGQKEAMRVQQLPNVVVPPVPMEEESRAGDDQWMPDAVSWIISACAGLYMGLLADGWLMARSLSDRLEMPALIWIAIVGIALLSALLLAGARWLIKTEASLPLVQIPWAGLWLLINLVLGYFAGNKLAALLSLIVLAVAFIVLRIRRYL